MDDCCQYHLWFRSHHVRQISVCSAFPDSTKLFGLERLQIFVGKGWVHMLEYNQNRNTFGKKKKKKVNE